MTFMKNVFQGNSLPSIFLLFSEVVFLPTTYAVRLYQATVKFLQKWLKLQRSFMALIFFALFFLTIERWKHYDSK